MSWASQRGRYCEARAAVEAAQACAEWRGLSQHQTVIAALVQIDMAERAIADVATEMEIWHCNKMEEEV